MHLEETYGYVYAYKRQGLFTKHGENVSMLTGMDYYHSLLELYGVPHPNYPSHNKWIYKIPRKW